MSGQESRVSGGDKDRLSPVRTERSGLRALEDAESKLDPAKADRSRGFWRQIVTSLLQRREIGMNERPPCQPTHQESSPQLAMSRIDDGRRAPGAVRRWQKRVLARPFLDFSCWGRLSSRAGGNL